MTTREAIEADGAETPVAQEQMLLAKLNALGGSAGNAALRKALNWDEELYAKIRASLVGVGTLAIGKGKGGSVRLVSLDAPVAPEAPSLETEKAKEVSHYPAIAKAMQSKWINAQGIKNFRLNVCASQGKKQTGGRWSRPDIIMVSVETFDYLPGKWLGVYTYEVKIAEAVDITSVFEAASHLRSVNYSYLFVVGKINSADIESNIRSACVEQGVGLILADKAGDVETWEEVVSPDRNDPDPKDLNNTISHFLEDKDWVKGMVR